MKSLEYHEKKMQSWHMINGVLEHKKFGHVL